MDRILRRCISDLAAVLPALEAMEPQLTRLGEALLRAWDSNGKALLAGNGGSAADAMHLAEEFVVRFKKNRRALPAIALLDPTAITCAGNDFGFDSVFARQVEAFANKGDVFICFTTSGNSANILRAIEVAKSRGSVTAIFLGNDGGKARGMCDIEFIVPSDSTARIQEAHQLLYHALCEWIDERVE